jgi:hypothetical protein
MPKKKLWCLAKPKTPDQILAGAALCNLHRATAWQKVRRKNSGRRRTESRHHTRLEHAADCRQSRERRCGQKRQIQQSQQRRAHAMDPKTGQILAMVGSKDYFDDAIITARSTSHCGPDSQDHRSSLTSTPRRSNRAWHRRPCSSMSKRILAHTAAKIIRRPTTTAKINGISICAKLWPDHLNVPAVKTLSLVGVQNAIDTMKDMGITSDLNTDVCGCRWFWAAVKSNFSTIPQPWAYLPTWESNTTSHPS